MQRTGLIGQRFDSLDRLELAARTLRTDPEGRKRLLAIRNHAIAALGLTDLRMRREHDLGDIYDIGVDAAFERYSVMEHSGEVVVRGLDDDRELARLPGPDRRDLLFSFGQGSFSPDGELLAACYSRETSKGVIFHLRIWHLGRRELLASLPGQGGFPAFHPDGRRLLFGAPEGGIEVWDRDERRVVRRLPLDFAPHELAIDPGGRRLAVNYNNAAAPRVAILELETGGVLSEWRSQVGDTVLAWSADGQLLAVGNNGSYPQVYVWNTRLGALASVLQGHTARVTDARFAHSGYLLATASWDGTTRLWDAASGEPLAIAPGSFRAFAPDDRRLAYNLGGTFGVWDLATGAERRTLHPGMLGNRTEVRRTAAPNQLDADASADGRLVATADEEGVRLWEPDTGRELAHLRAGFTDTVLFHPDGRSLITSSKWGLYRWPIRHDPDRGPDAIRIGPPELLRESASINWTGAAWMPDHRTLALLDNPNARVRLVDSGHPHPAWSHAPALDSGENRRMTSVAVSPDGRWLAVGGWKELGMRIWDLHRRRLERILKPKEPVGDQGNLVVFSPDGRWLASCTGAGAKASYHFWSVGTWDLGLRIDKERQRGRPLSPGVHRRWSTHGHGHRARSDVAGRCRHGARARAADDVGAVDPDAAGIQPRRHEARRQDEPEDGTGLGPAADPRPARAAGAGLGSSALSRGPGVERHSRPDAPAEAGPGRRRGHRDPGSPRPRAGRDQPPARRRSRRCRGPGPPRLAVHPAEEVARGDRRPRAPAPAAPGRSRRLLAPGRGVPRDGRRGRRPVGHRPAARTGGGPRRPILARVLRPPHGQAAGGRGRFRPRPRRRSRPGPRALPTGASPDPAGPISRGAGRPRDPYPEIPTRPRACTTSAATVREAMGDREPARADREKAGSLLPSDSKALNAQAWILATGPLMQRDDERAVALARRAVALARGERHSLNTLGVALYRTGRDAEAIPILERSLAAGKGEADGFDLFFLAMAHHRLAHRQQARGCLDRAVKWLDQQKNLKAGHVEELARFLAEAEAVLAGPIVELPDDVFAPRS